jgi:hypothetical protein
MIVVRYYYSVIRLDLEENYERPQDRKAQRTRNSGKY